MTYSYVHTSLSALRDIMYIDTCVLLGRARPCCRPMFQLGLCIKTVHILNDQLEEIVCAWATFVTAYLIYQSSLQTDRVLLWCLYGDFDSTLPAPGLVIW